MPKSLWGALALVIVIFILLDWWKKHPSCGQPSRAAAERLQAELLVMAFRKVLLP